MDFEHEERREARERENERADEGRESDARLKHVCALGRASLAAALWMLKRVTPLQGARRVSNPGEEERARGRDDALHLNPPSFQIALTFCLTRIALCGSAVPQPGGLAAPGLLRREARLAPFGSDSQTWACRVGQTPWSKEHSKPALEAKRVGHWQPRYDWLDALERLFYVAALLF